MLPLKKIQQKEPELFVSHKRNKRWEEDSFYNELLDLKKARYREFRRRKILHSSIGFMLSLLLIVGVFEWKTYDNNGEIELNQKASVIDELLDIPVTKQPPPPPKRVIKQPNIVEVSEEEIIEDLEIDLDMDISEETQIEEVVIEPVEMEEEVAEEIFLIVENAPEPPGGLAGFYTYVAKNIDYPSTALRMDVSGKVFVQFVVNTDGSLTDFLVVKGIGAGCDEEAVRVLKGSPKWTPGKQRGKNVRVRMVIPIIFKIAG